MQDNPTELLPLVDENGNVTGSATRQECHDGSHLLHPVVHLHVFNSTGELFLQRRPTWKDIQPGKWDTAVGGHIAHGETIEEALVRETREELGLEQFEPELLSTYIFESARDREFVYAFKTVTDTPPQPSEELDGGRFFAPEEIKLLMGRNFFTPNFEEEYMRLFGKQQLEGAE